MIMCLRHRYPTDAYGVHRLFIPQLLMLFLIVGNSRGNPRRPRRNATLPISTPCLLTSNPRKVPKAPQRGSRSIRLRARSPDSDWSWESLSGWTMRNSEDFDARQGQGRFLVEPGSDASVLLQDLKKALGAKVLPKKVRRRSSLSFVYVSFGDNESQAPNGGFNFIPPGHWTPMKIFIGEGDDEGQVFVNTNPVMRKGQFSIKGEEYGDIVLARLATVLQSWSNRASRKGDLL